MIWLFDIDGTLIRSGGAGGNAMAEALHAQFGVPAETRGVAFSGRTDQAIITDLLHAHGLDTSAETHRDFRNAYLQRLPQALHTSEGCVLDGVTDLLLRIQRRPHHSLGLLTGNMQDAADAKLGHFGLRQYFGFGGYGDTHADRNLVAADAVQRARQILGRDVDPQEIWVIGDTPRDIECARSQSLKVLAVATGGYEADELRSHAPDLLLDSLTHCEELDRLLQA